MERSDYLSMRERYRPETVELVIIAESPPESDKYFYKPSGRTTEPLFLALMKQLSASPITKDDGLQELQRRGWILVDATYQPVNKISPAKRNAVIISDYGSLLADLDDLTPGRTAPVILIKANVCDLLEPRLTSDRFRVLNKGRRIPFPVMHHTAQFHRDFAALVG